MQHMLLCMANDVGTQLRKGVVEYCVLGLLQREPTYGWKISEQLVSLGLIGSIGTLYPLLGRLRDQGFIIAQADESDSARPRKYYSLTPAGREQLGQFRAQWQPFTDAVSSIIALDESPAPHQTSSATPPKGTNS